MELLALQEEITSTEFIQTTSCTNQEDISWNSSKQSAANQQDREIVDFQHTVNHDSSTQQQHTEICPSQKKIISDNYKLCLLKPERKRIFWNQIPENAAAKDRG